MKINSEKLFEFVNNLGTNEKVKFKVFEDENYVTEIYWDGENFRWEPGTFTSGALFNPLYDFVVIEEEKKIPEKINIQEMSCRKKWSRDIEVWEIINEIIDYLKSKGNE